MKIIAFWRTSLKDWRSCRRAVNPATVSAVSFSLVTTTMVFRASRGCGVRTRDACRRGV